MKKRIYCHTCEKEYVITTEENTKKLENDYKCDYCGSDFIYVENLQYLLFSKRAGASVDKPGHVPVYQQVSRKDCLQAG